jgi:hypothetical protein
MVARGDADLRQQVTWELVSARPAPAFSSRVDTIALRRVTEVRALISALCGCRACVRACARACVCVYACVCACVRMCLCVLVRV